jgi:hypothetical protein
MHLSQNNFILHSDNITRHYTLALISFDHVIIQHTLLRGHLLYKSNDITTILAFQHNSLL